MAVVAGNEKAARVKAGGSFRNRLGDDLAWGRQAPAGHPLTRYQIAFTPARILDGCQLLRSQCEIEPMAHPAMHR